MVPMRRVVPRSTSAFAAAAAAAAVPAPFSNVVAQRLTAAIVAVAGTVTCSGRGFARQRHRHAARHHMELCSRGRGSQGRTITW